ncbi:hypothetical protein F5Y11DRAFT_313531 [Daldinia sp. FL1419]|nr:hypothetical protein F5Y11DRAFT_313531 [Daldinia sp. FL1419]
MHSLRRAAARAACSSIAAAAPRQQVASFAMQICKANVRPAAVMPLARYFSQTARVALDENESAAVEEAIESAGQPGSTAEQAAETVANKIYVRNFPYDITDDLLREAFSKYGEITSLQVARDPTGVSKGYAFISFADEASVPRAIEEANNSFWQGRRLFVQPRTISGNTARPLARGPAEPTTSLYIGNIPYETSDADLNNIFRDLENVVNVRVAVDRNTGWPRGFAHADFKDIESARNALEKLQGYQLGERTLRIDFAASSSQAPRNDRFQQRGRNQNRDRY